MSSPGTVPIRLLRRIVTEVTARCPPRALTQFVPVLVDRGVRAPGCGLVQIFSRSPLQYPGAGYFQRKCTKIRPKFFESFSTRW